MKRVLVLSISMLLSAKTLLPAAAAPDNALILLTTAFDASSYKQPDASKFAGAAAKKSAATWRKLSSKLTATSTQASSMPIQAPTTLTDSNPIAAAPTVPTWEWSANQLTGFGYWAGQPVKQPAQANGPADTEAAKPQALVQAHASQVAQLALAAAAAQAAPEATWSYVKPWTWFGSTQIPQVAPATAAASGSAQALAAVQSTDKPTQALK